MGKSDGGLLRYRLGSASDQESGAQGQNSWLELNTVLFFPHQKPIHQPTCQSQLTSKLIDGRKRSDENYFPYIGSYIFLYRFCFVKWSLGCSGSRRVHTGPRRAVVLLWSFRGWECLYHLGKEILAQPLAGVGECWHPCLAAVPGQWLAGSRGGLWEQIE